MSKKKKAIKVLSKTIPKAEKIISSLYRFLLKLELKKPLKEYRKPRLMHLNGKKFTRQEIKLYNKLRKLQKKHEKI
jgi:hypothetical protein